jgi:hypothetical protein
MAGEGGAAPAKEPAEEGTLRVLVLISQQITIVYKQVMAWGGSRFLGV